MKNVLTQSIILLLIGAISMIAQPRIEIEGGNSYSWGQVKPKDSPLKTTIKIKNSGDQELVIKNVKPSCGCTTAPLDKDKLKPGETANISVTFNAGNKSGKNNKTINITSNDPKKPNLIYTLSAEVVKSLTIEPAQYMTFSDLTVGVKQTSSLTLKNTGKKAIKFSDIEVSPKDMVVNIKENTIIKPGEKFTLKATVTPTRPGYLNCYVKMQTNDPDTGEVMISGYGNVKESSIYNNN